MSNSGAQAKIAGRQCSKLRIDPILPKANPKSRTPPDAVPSIGYYALHFGSKNVLPTLAAPAPAGGEVDVRGCYTAMAVAHMLCLDKAALSCSAGMVDFVRRCQV